MVESAVDRAPEGAARLPPLGVGEARSGTVQPPVHLGVVGGHRADISGRDHRISSHAVRAAALLATLVMKIYGSGEDRLYRVKAMKAVLFEKHGGPEVLRLAEVSDPVAGPGEVVVNIHAASVNAADYKVRLGGGTYSGSGVKLPHILGRDFSGVVSAVGSDVTDFRVGDPVFGVCDQGIEGAYAEKIAIKAAIIAKKPARLEHAEAAAMALTSITALWALEDTAKLKPGETILIQGGAGGVGGFGIPPPHQIGAKEI